jgi:hypothetical protein
MPITMRIWRFVALLLAVGVMVVAWRTGTQNRAVHEPGDFADYYRTRVSPLIDSAEARQQQSVDLALARLHEHFEYFRRGVPNFTRDVTSWRTRFAIVGRSVNDLWTRVWHDEGKAVAVRKYTEEKFRAWVINEQSLQKALEDTMATFTDATAANRNRLEAEIKLAIGHPESPFKMPALQLDQYLASAATASRGMAQRAGKDSALIGAGAFAGGWIAGDAARALTTAIIARLGTNAAVTTATSGSATAGGAAAGGGGGSAAGPVGTIIGLGVGIVAGALIDWAINDHFERKLSAQCLNFLNTLEQDLTNGVGGHPGIKPLLTKAAREGSESYRTALFAELLKADLP